MSSVMSFNKNFKDKELEAPDFELNKSRSLDPLRFPTKTVLEGV